jgi:hypothetical protein
MDKEKLGGGRAHLFSKFRATKGKVFVLWNGGVFSLQDKKKVLKGELESKGDLMDPKSFVYESDVENVARRDAGGQGAPIGGGGTRRKVLGGQNLHK